MQIFLSDLSGEKSRLEIRIGMQASNIKRENLVNDILPPRSTFPKGSRVFANNEDTGGISVEWRKVNMTNTSAAQNETASTPTSKEMADTNDWDWWA